MAFKFVVFAAALAYANAGLLGAPAVATYSAAPAVSSSYIHQAAAPLAVAHAAPVVSTYAHAPVALHTPSIGASHQTVLRNGLGGSVSQYSKAVDTAYSSVRKYDTRITNPALAVAHAAPVVSTYAHAAPVVSTYAHAAPVLSTYAHSAPVVAAHAAPVVAKTAVAYSPAAVVSHATFTGLGTSYAW